MTTYQRRVQNFLRRHEARRQLRYPELPRRARAAIRQYVGEEEGAVAMLRQLRARKFGVVTVPTIALIKLIWDFRDAPNEKLSMEHPAFIEYCHWYREGSGVVDHGTSRWAVILDVRAGDVLQDGWHRFHSYVARGHPTVLATFLERDKGDPCLPYSAK